MSSQLAQLPAGLGGTEVERLMRQRVGQQKFRAAMLDYWGGACAVTGLALSEVLRASHAKPWQSAPTMPSGWTCSTVFCWSPIWMLCSTVF